MSLKVIRNEISAVQQELLLKLEIKSIAMLEYTFKHFQPCGKDQIDHTYLNPAECAGNPAQTEKLIKEQRDTINYKERWNADSKCGHGCTRKSCNFVTNVSRTVDGDWSWRGFGYRNHVQKLAFFKPFFLFNELIFKQRNHSVSAAKGERTDF